MQIIEIYPEKDFLVESLTTRYWLYIYVVSNWTSNILIIISRKLVLDWFLRPHPWLDWILLEISLYPYLLSFVYWHLWNWYFRNFKENGNLLIFFFQVFLNIFVTCKSNCNWLSYLCELTSPIAQIKIKLEWKVHNIYSLTEEFTIIAIIQPPNLLPRRQRLQNLLIALRWKIIRISILFELTLYVAKRIKSMKIIWEKGQLEFYAWFKCSKFKMFKFQILNMILSFLNKIVLSSF